MSRIILVWNVNKRYESRLNSQIYEIENMLNHVNSSAKSKYISFVRCLNSRTFSFSYWSFSIFVFIHSQLWNGVYTFLCQFKSLHFVSFHFPKWGRFVYKPQKIEILVWISCTLFSILHQKSLIPWQAIVRYLLQLAINLLSQQYKERKRKFIKSWIKVIIIDNWSAEKVRYHGTSYIILKLNLIWKHFWKLWNISNIENLFYSL